MRVSNDTLRTAFLNALETAQRRIVDTQTQISTGRRVNTPSDDPIAAARIAQLDASLSKLDQYQSNGVIARNQLGLEEEALSTAVGTLQHIRELVVQGNNASSGSGERNVIAAEIREQRTALLALANTTDADGRYLFGGYSESAKPFTIATGGNVVYNGDQGQRTLQVSETRHVAINDSGSQIFQRMLDGNGTFALSVDANNTGSGVLGAGTVVNAAAYVRDTYTITFPTATTFDVRNSGNVSVASGSFTPPAQSITFLGAEVAITGAPAAGDEFTLTPSANRDLFATLDSLIATLETPVGDGAARARLNSNLAQRLADLDNATTHIIDSRAEIGARVRALDEQASLGADFSLQLTTTLSEIRDLDYAEALSRLSQQLFGLDAAQQAFARTQSLSLFRYL